jgi:recombinational DNA repair ATPase RecF
MIIAAAQTAQTALERPLLMLLDDPAAELDDDSLARLMARVRNLGCQVIATSLVPDSAIFGGEGAVFHVEHGELSRGS